MARLQLNAEPAASFDAPLEMLLGCHGRILKFCDALERLVHHLPEHGADAPARESAAAILRYFDTAGRYHHQDEEQVLFPLLIAADRAMAALIDELLAAHTEMDSAWAALRPMLEDLDSVQHDDFRPLAEGFAEINRQHVELENRELLPVAKILLDDAQLEQLGRAMAARRGVAYVSTAKGGMA